jgi:hypothetical protein
MIRIGMSAPLQAALAIAALVTLAACSAGSPAAPLPAGRVLLPSLTSGAGKIEHVVYIVQENRSFDDLFYGYPGADTVTRGRDSKGKWIPLQPVSLATVYTIDHSLTAMIEDCHGTGKLPGTDCRMDGFNKEMILGGPPGLPQYAYVPHSETKPYFEMAHEWVLRALSHTNTSSRRRRNRASTFRDCSGAVRGP